MAGQLNGVIITNLSTKPESLWIFVKPMDDN